jgi:endoglucanase
VHPVIHKQGWAIAKAEVRFARATLARLKGRRAKELFGGFAFRAHHWTSGRRIYTRAADDLAGVFCIVATALEVFAQPNVKKAPFIGLLTRAEEVGFVGAIRHFEQSPLTRAKRPVLVVSLEASRTLPGAIVGKGPVVRLGDRRTVFNSGALHVLSALAEKTLPGRHQRRVMDGGTCEATAATAWGLTTLGITLPLGNYHNQGLEGGMDCPRPQGPAPEFVHLDDIDGELQLCQALLAPNLPWADPWAQTRARLRQNAASYNTLL